MNHIFKEIFISIPEEFFIVCFTLILLRREDLLDKFYLKKNIINILFKAVIPLSILFNMLGYVNLNEFLRSMLQIILLSVSIYIICQNGNQNSRGNIFTKSLIAYGSFILIEGIVVGITYLIMGNMIDFENLSSINMFIILIPERIIEYGILFYILKSQDSNINFIQVVQSNNDYCRSLAISSGINIFYLIFFIRLFILEHLIEEFDYRKQLLIIVLILCFPIINFWMLWFSNHDIYIKELHKFKYGKECKYEENNESM